MKNSLITALIMMNLLAFSQQTLTKAVGEFSTVKVYDLISVKMIKSDKNEVVISGSNKSDVELVNKNGVLKIRMNIEELYAGDNTKVLLYYTEVDVIDANEGSVIEVQGPIKQYEIDLKSSGRC